MVPAAPALRVATGADVLGVQSARVRAVGSFHVEGREVGFMWWEAHVWHAWIRAGGVAVAAAGTR